jgi:hypothetical protein
MVYTRNFVNNFVVEAVKNDFFGGNILSFIDLAPLIDKIEMGRLRIGNLMKEELKISFH